MQKVLVDKLIVPEESKAAFLLSDEHIKRLDACSAIDLGFPHDLLAGATIQQAISGGVKVERR